MNFNNFLAVKNAGEATKNFAEVINTFFEPDIIDLAVAEGHKQFIKKALDYNSADENALYFLCGYKKMIKEMQRCKNIVDKAFDFIENSAKPHEIEADWLDFFFDKAKLISNCDMQLIWAKLLAEEANKPGKISLSLLHALSIMRYEQAEIFCNISRFALRAYKKEEASLLLFVSKNRETYEYSNITPKNLKELERLGLVECDFNTEYVLKNKENTKNKMVFISGTKKMTVYGDPDNDNKIKVGNVVFTNDGRALYDIIDSNYKKHRSEIFRYIIKKFKSRNCRVLVNDIEV